MVGVAVLATVVAGNATFQGGRVMSRPLRLLAQDKRMAAT